MKKYLMKAITVCVIMVVFVCSTFCVSAIESPDVIIDFNDGTSFGFIPPGDLNADGKTSADDLVIIRSILLNTSKDIYSEVYAEMGSKAKFSDANGDTKIDIRDLVRAKKCASKIFIDSEAGTNGSAAMNINGNVAYSKTLSDSLQSDKYYQISFSYKADEELVLTIKGISNQVYTFKSKQSTDWQLKTYLFATAEEFVSDTNIELQICGIGVVDDINITPCNIDNDISDIW